MKMHSMSTPRKLTVSKQIDLSRKRYWHVLIAIGVKEKTDDCPQDLVIINHHDDTENYSICFPVKMSSQIQYQELISHLMLCDREWWWLDPKIPCFLHISQQR